MKRTMLWALGALTATVVLTAGVPLPVRNDAWTDDELDVLRALWIESLGPLDRDPSNRFGDDPRAAALGKRLFFDARLSADGRVACGSCHLPERQFQDGTPFGKGVGITDRRTMTVVATAYGPWFFWDGRKDSQWAQALGPLESPVEHGGTRTQYARVVAASYRAEYEEVFGSLPGLSHLPPSAGPVTELEARAAWDRMAPSDREAVNRVFANMGKAIAAYQRGLGFGSSRFDGYVEAALARDRAAMSKALDANEVAGLRLFTGKARCLECHDGPLFTNQDFHNVGVPAAAGQAADAGRAAGVQAVLADEFNCLGPYSDAAPEDCAELRYVTAEGENLVGAFKTPTLRNVARRPPYMHAGQLATLREVVEHYDRAPAASVGHSELEPLGLSRTERVQLEAFLRALTGPIVNRRDAGDR